MVFSLKRCTTIRPWYILTAELLSFSIFNVVFTWPSKVWTFGCNVMPMWTHNSPSNGWWLVGPWPAFTSRCRNWQPNRWRGRWRRRVGWANYDTNPTPLDLQLVQQFALRDVSLYAEKADMGVTMQTPPWLGLNLGDPIRFGDIPIGIQFLITVQVGFQTWIQLYSEIPFCSEVAISRFSHVSFNTWNCDIIGSDIFMLPTLWNLSF